MISVLFVESGSGFGGSATCLGHLVKELDKRRFRPVVAHHAEGPGIERIRRLGIPTVRLHRGRAWLELVELIGRERVDLVHANNELYSHLATVLAANATRRPCLMHMRGIRKLTRGERWLARRVARFVVISEAARRFYLADGLAPGKTETIYDGVDLSLYAEGLDGAPVRRAFGISDSEVAIGIVSRLVPKKGQREFLEALARLAKEFPQVRGVIAGGDPAPDQAFRKELERLAQSLGIARQVVFAGWRDDVPQLNASLDIAVQATQYVEGLCAAVAEAMAAGRPVVASRVGGIPELIVDGQTGALVEPGSAQALAAALRPLIADASLRRRFGDAGHARMSEILDQRQTVRQVEQAYERMLGAKAG